MWCKPVSKVKEPMRPKVTTGRGNLLPLSRLRVLMYSVLGSRRYLSEQDFGIADLSGSFQLYARMRSVRTV